MSKVPKNWNAIKEISPAQPAEYVPLVYVDAQLNTLEIGFEALNKMLEYQQKYHHLPESGGVLIGRVLTDSNNTVIDLVSEPCSHDKQKRFAFFRSNAHQDILTQVWQKSNGTLNYLGEWHTHPEEHPTPSQTDFTNWNKKLKSKGIDTVFLYFIIIGTKSIGVWQGNMKNITIQKMSLYDKSQTK